MLKKKLAKNSDEDNKTPWGVGEAIAVGLGAFLVPQLLVGLAIAMFVNIRGGNLDEVLNNSNYFLAFVLTIAISGLGAWIIYAYARSKKGINSLGFRRTSPGQVALALPAYLVYFIFFIVINAIIVGLFPELNLNQAQDIGFNGASGFDLVFAFVTLVMIAPVYEEMLFRGFVFRGVASRVGLWPAAIAVSALFGLAHGQLNVAIDTFILGMVASWLVWRTKSIWPGIMLHVLKNLIAYIFLFIIKVNV